MKKIILLLILVAVAQFTFAQAPQKMSYQAVIRNASNSLVVNTTIGTKASILQGSANGTLVYAESHTANTNTDGLLTLEIGTGSVVSGSFATINWANGPFFIKTETDPSGGTNYTITGTTQLISVPFALYALNSGSSIPGPQGEKGDKGDTGDQGPQGIQGPIGPQGLQGATGATGPQGEKGDKGDKGDTGADGLTTSVNGVTQMNGAITINTSHIADSEDKRFVTDAQLTVLGNTSGTNTGDQDLSGLATTTDVSTALSLKVDKVTGKGLSTEDYSTAEKTKLAAITGTNTGDQDISGIATNTSAITALQTEQITQNTAIALNTAKVTNATHTGDVTGATVLTIANDAVTTTKIADGAVIDDKIANGISASKITGNIAGNATNITGIVAIANGGTGSATQNFVDLTTNQTIAGNKTFSTDVTINGIKVGKGTGSTQYSTVLGYNSLGSGNTGDRNTAIGYDVLRANTTGSSNSSVGFRSLYSNITGVNNTAIGDAALIDNNSGSYNSVVGSVALRYNTTGSSNTALGYNAGTLNGDLSNNTVSTNSVFIGRDSRALASNGSNEIVIGASAIGNGSNTVTLGNNSITNTYLKGSVAVGTTTPNSSAQLDVSSETKGFLMPRMTSAQRTLISNPATGLMVFQTDGTSGYYFYNGSDWVILNTVDASASTKGLVQLAGDLTGTATSPTIAASAVTTTKLADGSVTNDKIATGISASKVGLGNVDNTSDANKPISSATQTALNNKVSQNLTREDSKNADNYTTAGEYAIGSGWTNVNGLDYGTLKVTVSSDVIGQTISNHTGQIAYRGKSGGTSWTAWSQLNTSDSGWHAPTFENNWANLGSHNDVAYRKLNNVVYVRGTISRTGGLSGHNIFTLPEGYRPFGTVLFATVVDNKFAQIRVNSSGQVFLEMTGQTVGASVWVSLDGIIFIAEN